MARHSAGPDIKNRPRLAQHFRFVEKDITEPPPNNHAEEGATGDEIRHPGRRQIGITPLGQKSEQKISANKCEHISHAVPARPESFRDMKNERIEVVQVIGEHRWRSSTMLEDAAIQ